MSDAFEGRLSEYVDGALTGEDSAAVEDHLAACASCAQAVEDLRRVVSRARELGNRPPPRDLWPGIAARITESDRQHSRIGSATRASGPGWRQRRIAFSIPQLAAAAVVLMAISAGGMALIEGSRSASGGMLGAGPEGGRTPIAPSLTSAEGAAANGYGQAIAQLQEAIFYGRDELDSLTVRKLVANLQTIDRAIEEARQALEADASDPYLRHHLAEARRQKVRFLRQTAALVAART